MNEPGKLIQNQDLSKKDLRNSDFSRCLMDDVDFTQSDLRGTSFLGAELRNVHLTMTCPTFENVTIDARTMKLLLFLIGKLNVQPENLPIISRIELMDYLKNLKPPTWKGVIERMIPPEDRKRIKAYMDKIEQYDAVENG